MGKERNSACERKMCGMRKCMSDQSSMRLFCSGVPIRSSRRLVEKPSSVCQRVEGERESTSKG